LPVDILDLEFANSNFSNLDIFKKPKFTKMISIGVVDVHTHTIEDKETVKQNLKKALQVFDPEKVLVDPDCGLKTRTPEEAKAKLKVIVEAVKEVKQEFGLK